jgi:bifunctional non-homologous end joining protein LigD
MLTRPGLLPTRPGWSFEPKWDGFRAVRTGGDYAVRSRRGWLMTELLPEFSSLPISGVFDGELVAFGKDGKPSLRRICGRRILARDESVPVALVLFDVLELDGETTARWPYRRRRELLETLDFAGCCQLCPRFDDGAALWQAIREHQLEGVVAKRLDEPYRPGERT